MTRKNFLTALLFGVLALLPAPPLSAQQVTVSQGAVATTVWQYSPTCGAGKDYPDVPARPFLVGPLGQTAVMWFAANSDGSFASVGVGASPDILASLQRGTTSGPGCVSWLPAAQYQNTAPASYDGGLWMVAPFTPDGIHVQALVHNEFHGEWTGDTSWCWLQNLQQSIFLPCNYWNIVSASSSNAGQSFQLYQQAGTNVPAIVLGKPYIVPQDTTLLPNDLPQGMTAQSNIIEVGGSYYVLVQQLPYQPPRSPTSSQNGVCIYRAVVPFSPGAPLMWMGWGGSDYTVRVPVTYPAIGPEPYCKPVLDAPFRFSWSFNTILNQLIIIGQDTFAGIQQRGVSRAGCPYAPNATATTVDSAFVYTTATLVAGQLSAVTPETCLLQINSIGNWQANPSLTGQAYPSLLDPTSPEIAPGDRNFMHSGQQPYLYFTQLNPRTGNSQGYDRDLVRLPLTVTGTTSR